MEVGDRIRLSRIFAGLSQAALAEKLDVQQTSITRYESKGEGHRPAGNSITNRVAVATGMPGDWITDGKPFTGGPYAGRIEMPNIKYSNKTIRAIEDQLAALIPQFLLENKPTDIAAVYPDKQVIPHAFVISSETYCLVLFAIESANLISKHLEISRYVPIKVEDWVAAYMQPKYQYLGGIIDAAHGQVTVFEPTYWRDKLKIMPGKEWSGSNEKGFLVSYTPPPGFNREALLTENIIGAIHLAGCTNVKCVINEGLAEKEPQYPSFVPNNFKMIWLEDAPQKTPSPDTNQADQSQKKLPLSNP
jgi:transcriptional regulator with XRE-family HTH domain